MNVLSERILFAIRKAKLSYSELSDLTNIPKAALQRYATGKTAKVPLNRLEAIAKATNVSPKFFIEQTTLLSIGTPTITTVTKSKKPLGKRFRQSNDENEENANVIYVEGAAATELCEAMGWDHPSTTPSRPRGVRIPVYGSVAAGIPIEAITDIEDYEEITEEMARSGKYAALKIKGNSMEPRFTEGDVVIVRIQEDVDSGDIAIVLVNGDEATCKKIKKTPEGVMLISTNPAYEPMFYSNKEIEELPVRIWGKVVELRAKF